MEKAIFSPHEPIIVLDFKKITRKSEIGKFVVILSDKTTNFGKLVVE